MGPRKRTSSAHDDEEDFENPLVDVPDLLPQPEAEKGGNMSLLCGQVVFCFLTYFGYVSLYFGKADLAVSTPSLSKQGILDEGKIGDIQFVATLVYAASKLSSSGLLGLIGPRKIFLGGLIGAGLASVAFPFCHNFWLYAIVWTFNLCVQAGVWTAVVQMVGAWFDFKWHARIVSSLSTSYLVGDAVARLFLSGVVLKGMGLSWHYTFFVAGGYILVMAVLSVLFLRSSPKQIGKKEGLGNPETVNPELQVGSLEDFGIGELLMKAIKSRRFYLVVIMNACLCFSRELFRQWSPTLLMDKTSLLESDSGFFSAAYPAGGVISALLYGYLGDRATGKRGCVMFGGCIVMTASVVGFWYLALQDSMPLWLGATALFTVGFTFMGPYVLLSAFSLDLGGKKAAGVFQGIQDCAGYLAGAVSSKVTGSLLKGKTDKSERSKAWSTILAVICCLALLAVVSSLIYSILEIRANRRKVQRSALYQPIAIDGDDEENDNELQDCSSAGTRD